MCTSIVEIVDAEGKAKLGDDWFALTHAVVAYDHARHALLDDAIIIDFVNHAMGPGARAAVELTLESARALQAALERAIRAAEIEEGGRVTPSHRLPPRPVATLAQRRAPAGPKRMARDRQRAASR